MKIRTQLSTAPQSGAARAKEAGAAEAGPFAALLQDLEPVEGDPRAGTAPDEASSPDDDADPVDENVLGSVALPAQRELRQTQAPLRVTLYWNTQPTDPRSAGVRLTGSTDSRPYTLTTRESGLEARGLQSGAVPPGGAGTDSTLGPLGTESDSREVPPPTGTSQSHGGTSPVADAAERLRAANVATPDGGTAARDAPATDADAPTIAAREPGADVRGDRSGEFVAVALTESLAG